MNGKGGGERGASRWVGEDYLLEVKVWRKK